MAESNKKVLILVVEDEKILVETLQEKLEGEGFEVLKSYDGEEGLNLALTQHPDLILLDLLMPKVDGLQMLKKLRQDPWGLHANVIVLTNVSDPANVIVNAGFVGIDTNYEYLVKADMSLEDLISKIKHKLAIK